MAFNTQAALQAGWSPQEIQSYLATTGRQFNAPFQPKQQPSTSGDGFDLLSLLPLVGAVGGSFIPGAGTIAGGALGAGAGELIRQGLKQEDVDVGRVVKEGALGGAGGVLGKVAGPAFRGAGKALGIGKGVGQALTKGVVRPSVAAGPFAIETEANIVRTLQKLGIRGSAEAQRKQIPAVFRNLTSQIDDILAGAKGVKVSGNEVKSLIKTSLQGNVNFDRTIPAFAKAEAKFLNQVTKALSKKGNPASNLFGYKKTLNKQLSRVFTKVEKGTPLNPQEEVALSVWKSIDDVITGKIPAVKGLTTDQSILFQASPGLKRSAETAGRLPFVGRVPGVGRATQGAQDVLGRGLQAAGGAQLPTPAGGLLSQIGGRAAAQQGVRALAPGGGVQGPVEEGTVLPPGIGGAAQPAQAAPLISREQAIALMLQFPKEAATIQKIFEFGQTGGEADLTTEQQKKITNLQILQTNLNALVTNLGQVQGRGAIGGRLGVAAAGLTGGAVATETADFEALRKGLIGPVARAISGEVGVLTDKDIARAEDLLPKVTDAPQLAQRKIQNLQQLIEEQQRTLRTGSALPLPQSLEF